MSENDYNEYRISDDVPVLTPAEQEKEIKLICENIELIFNNSHLIINNEKYFYTKTSMTIAGGYGPGLLYMGIMCQLWQNNEFIDKCSDCGGKIYILGVGGSPFSGNHQWWGCCSTCKELKKGRKQSFRELIQPARDIAKKYPNYSIVRRYKLKSKEWFNKLTEKRRPDEVIRKKKSGVSLEQLIIELKKQ